MASFYNQGGSGGTYNATGGGGAGFYNTAGPTTTSTSSTTTSTTTSSMTGMGGPSIPPQGTTYEQQSFGGSGSGMAHQQQQQSVYGNTQQWHQPTGQKQQHMYGQTPIEQQQQQPPAQPFWNPQASAAVSQAAAGFVTQAMTGSLSGDGVLDMASRLGTEAFKSGVPGLDGVMQTLRAYFAVDNRYVKRKMQKVLFPFTSKQWKRFVSYTIHGHYRFELLSRGLLKIKYLWTSHNIFDPLNFVPSLTFFCFMPPNSKSKDPIWLITHPRIRTRMPPICTCPS